MTTSQLTLAQLEAFERTHVGHIAIPMSTIAKMVEFGNAWVRFEEALADDLVSTEYVSVPTTLLFELIQIAKEVLR